MPYQPHLATVVSSERISPNFQRVRFSGLDAMGPQGPALDIRIKLIIPGEAGLPEVPCTPEWFPVWQSLDHNTRGAIRTYSVREFDRNAGELDIDFVVHTAPGLSGPASTWAIGAQPGDQIYVIAPQAQDPEGLGIEFNPGGCPQAHLYGDETALPALARIVCDWPQGLRGTVDIEIPDAADQQELPTVDGLTVTYHVRQDQAHGALLADALATHLTAQLGRPFANPLAGATPEGPAGADGEAAGASASSGPREVLWETPSYSASGEELGTQDPHADYWWIAGEASAVKAMRRLLVREAEISRSQVSFMGYWKRGVAEN
ncbi:siderophore-interacting protein [Corynebacterium lizhenjunii]|uniref:Siderophore-interacting protein n=1 Tax=Corynebacterium lizhenjunii TaxID=2709394 RepID=A0A7T0KEP3_9CORY|nr:siderophore-interacting protein [Corynebacterium lizhenjunii]QPK78744.1 siderophore-interacting protein [Corynebacterium lizhenjunii]